MARYNVTNKNASYDTAYSRYHTGATLDTSTGELEATSFIKTGGTSSQFLKADGSVDSNTYALASAIPTVDATPTASSTNAVSSGGVYSAIENISPGTLDTTNISSQTTSSSESLSGNIKLHKIAKTGSNDDLIDAPWKFDERGLSSDKNNIYVDGRRGTTNGYYSTAEGYNCDTGGTATANTKSYNQSNIQGRCAHAEGNSTIAQGQDSHSEGIKTFAAASASHAEGGYTEARGYGSHSEGIYTIARGNGGHAEGQYNLATSTSSTFGDAGNTLHSIGIGTSENNRKNAIEVMQNGDMYVIGIGNYDGTNFVNANTLQEHVDTTPFTDLDYAFIYNTTLTGLYIDTFEPGDQQVLTNAGVTSIEEYAEGVASGTLGNAFYTLMVDSGETITYSGVTYEI